MKRGKESVDGFIGRNRKSDQDKSKGLNRRSEARSVGVVRADRKLHSGQDFAHSSNSAKTGLQASSLSESLRAIDDEPKRSYKPRKVRKPKKPATPFKKRLKIFAIILFLILLLVGGWYFYKVVWASGKLFGGNIFDAFQSAKLQEDSYGRSNFLIVGTTDDDPNRDGADLTDSLMVLSVNQTTKNAFMFSVPRDLYVRYGEACEDGYAGKINAYMSCVKDGTGDAADKAAMDSLREFIGNIYGMDLQYGVHVNSLVIRDGVNAVGGITVEIGSRDPRGILDSNFDWKCGETYSQRISNCPPSGHYIDFPNGPKEMDGEMAMWFSRARGVQAPTYGLEESNFDRERNQQLIVTALQKKAVSAGTLANPAKVSSLIDAMGNNLKTNIQTREIRTLMSLAQEINPDSIEKIDFFTEENPLYQNSTIDGASVVIPAAGTYNYSQLKAEIRKKMSTGSSTAESDELSGNVIILNGSGVAGAAAEAASELESLGFTVESTGNANNDYSKTTIYKIGTVDESALSALEKKYGATALNEIPNTSISDTTDFVIVLGRD